MNVRARIGISLLATGAMAGLLYGFAPRPLAVEVATATRGPLRVVVEEEGKTRVKERYVIAAPVAGQLRRIALEAGDRVEAGQTLAVIEPAWAGALDARSRAQAAARLQGATAAWTAAEENARAARAQALLARQTLARLRTLHAQGFVSVQALDQAATEAERAEAAAAAAEHGVRVARFERDSARAALLEGAGAAHTVFPVRAPVTGHILRVLRESEGPVNAGQALLELGDPRALEVEVEVLSTQAVRIAPGTRVEFDRWGGAIPLEGRVRRVEPTGFTKVSALGVEEQRVRVIADFTSPPALWERLGDGYRVEARFVVWEGKDVLQIPASSLIRHDGGWAVYRLEGGRARLAPVSLGNRAGLAVEVLGGLAPGDYIVSHPTDQLRDGIRITPRRTP